MSVQSEGAPVLTEAPARPLRVLLAHRLDVLARAMDSSIISQWLALDGLCELVIWSPGLQGFVAGLPLDLAADRLDVDIVLLPDYHHAIAGLWDELWSGAERCRQTVIWHLSDHLSAVEERRRVLERVRPAGVLAESPRSSLAPYADLIEALGIEVLPMPWGFDRVLFHPPVDAPDRDIDILVAGADDSIYPTRERIKRAARSLANEFRVCDLRHPGYWETDGVFARGQSQYADLLRRSRLATTGSVMDTLPRKYWEAASCGAIPVGDLPDGARNVERFTPAVLEVAPVWNEERIAEEMRLLLHDPARCARMREAGVTATLDAGHREQGHELVATLRRMSEHRDRPHRPLAFATMRPTRLVCAAPEPEGVPGVRPDWVDVWGLGAAGLSRTRRTELALDGTEDVVVLAFDPDAALTADALLLASACRSTGRIALRPGAAGPASAPPSWSAVAAPLAKFREAIAGCRGRAGVERALVELGLEIGWEVLDGEGYVDPAGDLVRLYVQSNRHGVERALLSAAQQSRTSTAFELAGLRAFNGWGEPPSAPPPADLICAPQDPELDLRPGARFARFHPMVESDLAKICEHARLGQGAPPLYIGVPLNAGISLEGALAALSGALDERDIDLDSCADLIILERPLFTPEVQWLSSALGAPGAGFPDPEVPAPGDNSNERQVTYS